MIQFSDDADAVKIANDSTAVRASCWRARTRGQLGRRYVSCSADSSISCAIA
jgi:hypothetical protein